MKQVDVVVVGGGPAGLSAALVLGRCRRTVLVFDHGRYRNAAARAVHGFLTRDGHSPVEMRRVAREELSRYPTVSLCAAEVTSARTLTSGFELETADHQIVRCRKLVLATGLIDRVPSVPGMEELLGKSVFHCAYCDAWEVREQPLVAYAHGDSGARFALGLLVWTDDVVLCTDGGELPGPDLQTRLTQRGITLLSQGIEKVSGDDSHVDLLFRDGSSLHRRALFYSVGCRPASTLAEQLGARFVNGNSVHTGDREESSVPGVYVAGDASRDALQAVVAAGEGSKAAVAINSALVREDLWGEQE